jgi:hypothetical protein
MKVGYPLPLAVPKCFFRLPPVKASPETVFFVGVGEV